MACICYLLDIMRQHLYSLCPSGWDEKSELFHCQVCHNFETAVYHDLPVSKSRKPLCGDNHETALLRVIAVRNFTVRLCLKSLQRHVWIGAWTSNKLTWFIEKYFWTVNNCSYSQKQSVKKIWDGRNYWNLWRPNDSLCKFLDTRITRVIMI